MSENQTQKLKDLLINTRKLIDEYLALLTPPIKSTQELNAKIPEDLRPLVAVEETDEAFIIRPRQFLGTENFSKILDIIKKHGGQYISAGKDSRFEIPRRS